MQRQQSGDITSSFSNYVVYSVGKLLCTVNTVMEVNNGVIQIMISNV